MSVVINLSLNKIAEKMQKEGVNLANNSEVRKKCYEILKKHYDLGEE